MAEPTRQAADFDGRALARHLIRTVRAGALATLDRGSGAPFASLVTVATDMDGSPLLLMSRLAAHTVNLEADPRASILLAETGRGDPLAHPRLTVIGQAERSTEPRIRARFLARHPKAKLYADFADFSFWRLAVSSGHLNGGFARAATLSGGDMITELTGADDLLGIEAEALDHLNTDHPETLALYATRIAGASPGPWRATGLDPEGLDLAAGDLTARIRFPERITGPGALRRILKDIADEARTRPDGNP
jgi:putative heme iron utilization protein